MMEEEMHTGTRGRLKWEGREDMANRFALLGLAFWLGWIACSAYDKVPTLWQKKNQLERVRTVELPVLKAQVRETERERAVAVQALKSVGEPVPSAALPAQPMQKAATLKRGRR